MVHLALPSILKYTLSSCGQLGVNKSDKTKLDPVRPNETLPVEKYIDDLVPYIEEYGFGPDRVVIQSFDWRTLIGIKEKFPAYTTVALLDDTTIIAEDRDSTGYPWLGGIDASSLFPQ